MDCSWPKYLTLVLNRKEKEIFLANVVWNMWMPIEVESFAWETTLEGILTLNQLKKWG